MSFRWIGLLLLVGLAYSAQGQVVRAQLDPDSTLTFTGSSLGIRWVANVPSDAVLQAPNLEEWVSGSEFDFLVAQDIDTLVRQGQVTYSQYFYVLAKKEGTFTLDPLTLKYLLGPSTETVETRAVKLTIRERPGVKGMEDYMADNKPLVREPSHWTDYIVWILLGGVLIALGILAYVFLGRPDLWRKPKVVPPTELARARLEALKKKGYIEQEAYSDYYAELSSITRELIQNETGFPAMSSSSSELRTWGKENLPAKLKTDFEEFLVATDLVKFAKATPLSEGIRFMTTHVDKLITYYEAKNSEAA